MTATHRVGRKGSKPPSKSQHFSNVIIFLAALEYDVEMREVALRTPDHLHLHWHTVLCVITNNPVTFFSESLLKKLNNRVYTKTFCMCFPKFHFWEKFHSHRDDKKQILYISKASFIQDQRTKSTIILKILLWNRSTKRSTIKCILSLSSLIYFLYKMLVTVASL